MTENSGISSSASLKAIAKLIEASAKAGLGVLQSLYGAAPGSLTGIVDWAKSESCGAGCGPCEIPPPCWMPRPLCDVVSHGKAGNTASITFEITNQSMTTRVISIFTTSPSTGLVFSAPQLTLSPMEAGSIEVTYTIPTPFPSGPGTEILLWIQGCRLHFLRWKINSSSISGNTNYEVCVCDGPEYLHHWYDHFYCPRPCLPPQRVPGQ
jgi:hypothetical protein